MRCLSTWIAAAALASLLGCAHEDAHPVATARASHRAPVATTTTTSAEVEIPEPDHPVTLFVADEPCGTPNAREAKLNAASPEDAVNAIVREAPVAKVHIDEAKVVVENQTARVDLRPNQKQSLKDAPACETAALLTSIRRTLTANAHWQITRVVFTERGDLLAV